MTTTVARAPIEVQDAADTFTGASTDDLIRAHSTALDQIYVLRGVFAWAAVEIGRALAFKGFSTSRRAYGEKQAELLARCAHGDAVKVKFDRQSHYIEAAARREHIPTWLGDAIPTLDTAGGHVANPEHLPMYVAYAYNEILVLRQLAAYEAGVARAHDTPSGPKKVRTILEKVEQRLRHVATAETLSAADDELHELDVEDALAAVGATAPWRASR